MNKIRVSRASIFYFLTVFIVAVVYVIHAPRTVQTGDSGELTAAAYRLLVAHPPGYPLWIWLNHLWIHSVSFGTVFFNFSLLNILISIATLWVFGSFTKSLPLKVLGMLSLGLSTVFWRYAQIPEVFALHLLLSVLTIWAGISSKNITGTKIPVAAGLMPLFFSLGIAHHQTIIFLLPFVSWVCWRYRNVKWLYVSIASGMVVCVALYSSMLAMHPTHLYSWGNLQNLGDVWDHFLRKEYGTFSLQHQTHENAILLQIRLFIINLFQAVWALAVLGLITIFLCKRASKQIVWHRYQTFIAWSLAAYVLVFIPMMQTAPINFFAEVSERFFILPILLTAILLCTFIDNNFEFMSKSRVWSVGLLALSFSLNSYTTNSRYNDLSDNTIIEDYAINILNITSEFKNPILFSSMDTEFFSIRYAQLVENIQPKTLVLLRIFFGTEWFVQKGIPQIKNFKYSYEEQKRKSFQITLDDIILPNLDNFTFITTDDEFPPEAAKVTFLPLGFLITQGAGIDFYKTKYTPQFRSDLSIIDTSPYLFNSYRGIFSRYTYYFAVKGQMEAKQGKALQAIDSFERILGLAPYTYQALENLCKLKEKLNIADKKCSMREEFKEYFDYYRYHNIKR
ncbi:protein O-mannosyl-transferase family [Bdellovibrio sp. HCB185ZH]|uniref:protein O-mannosyl-transferase family n=1 Tax=Bdellovibrio sp. HCB185ZH TaxID=3394235 RepID=UPI0039A552E5